MSSGPSRLLFGTDSSFFPRGWQRGIVRAAEGDPRRARCQRRRRELIFGGNFERLFPVRPSGEAGISSTIAPS